MNDVDKLAIREAPGGAVLAVKAVPGASRDRIVGVLGDCLKVAVSAPPEKGKANDALVAVLARAFGLGRRGVELVSGAGGPRKEFRLVGLSPAQARAALGKL